MDVSLTLYIKKISPKEHEFRYVRSDGGCAAIVLDTKRYLVHDLIHFVVEDRAHLKDSFYGKLARGVRYTALLKTDISGSPLDAEHLMTMRIVGGLTPVLKEIITPEQFLAGARNLLVEYNTPIPVWLDQGFIADIQENLRIIISEWNTITIGDTLILRFKM